LTRVECCWRLRAGGERKMLAYSDAGAYQRHQRRCEESLQHSGFFPFASDDFCTLISSGPHKRSRSVVRSAIVVHIADDLECSSTIYRRRVWPGGQTAKPFALAMKIGTQRGGRMKTSKTSWKSAHCFDCSDNFAGAARSRTPQTHC